MAQVDPGVVGRLRALFVDPGPAQSVLDLLGQERIRRRAIQTWAAIGLLFIIVFMYAKAVYNQRDVIAVFNRDIDTQNLEIMNGAHMLGPLLSPSRIALICEFPGLYTILGYSSPYTGPIVKALTALQPSSERVVLAMMLLENGLAVQPGTSPPTIFQEVINNVFPKDTFVPPQPIIKPPSAVKQAATTAEQIMPIVMQAVFFLPMIFMG
jgi:hypothetical protein